MKRVSIIWLVFLQWILAFTWLHSGFGKWMNPGFMNSITKTLEAFTTNNPYTWYANFLHSVAIPHATLFGNIIRSGELLIGIALAIAGILLLKQKTLQPAFIWLLIFACFGGALMNLNFFLASGWMSPSGWSLNIMMTLIQVLLGVAYWSERKQLTTVT